MPIDGPSLVWLTEEAGSELRAEARAFCLRMINEVYEIDYTPTWHVDLDSLLSAGTENWFSDEMRGRFLIVQGAGGRIVATGGFYGLERKPSTMERLRDRYSDVEKVCQIVRVYVEQRARRKGLGSLIVEALESKARKVGYLATYLHADAKTPGALGFWRSQGYSAFGRFSYPSSRGTDSSVDFEKVVHEDD